MSTEENLATAFAGESQANRKYTAFARKADHEGYPGIAKLFRAAAAAETVHALNHFNVMGGVKSTKENLATAVAGETYEFTDMYPGFIDAAKGENHDGAVVTFSGANAVEKIHGALFQKALDEMSTATGGEYYVCNVCGFTVEGAAPDNCPVCNASRDQFAHID